VVIGERGLYMNQGSRIAVVMHKKIKEMLPYPFLRCEADKFPAYGIMDFLFSVIFGADPDMIFGKVELGHHLTTKLMKKMINGYLCNAGISVKPALKHGQG